MVSLRFKSIEESGHSCNQTKALNAIRMIGLHKRKTPVREITDHRRDRNAEAVRQNGRHVRAVHQREHQHRAQRHHPAIDDIAAEILAENVSARLEDKKFIANIGVGDRQNIGWNQQNQIVHMRSQQTVKRRVHPHAEHRVPAADDEIHGWLPKRITLQFGKKSTHDSLRTGNEERKTEDRRLGTEDGGETEDRKPTTEHEEWKTEGGGLKNGK